MKNLFLMFVVMGLFISCQGSDDDKAAPQVFIQSVIIDPSSNTNDNVLSAPSMMIFDNVEATIQIGKEVPSLSGSLIDGNEAQHSVLHEGNGSIILKITTQIVENDTVRLTISQEITDVIESADQTVGPTFDKKRVETVVLAKNKQTIMIGGLMDDKATVSTEKVPMLGTLFRNHLIAKQKSNLIVYITPHIIRDRKDYLAVLKENGSGQTQ